MNTKRFITTLSNILTLGLYSVVKKYLNTKDYTLVTPPSINPLTI